MDAFLAQGNPFVKKRSADDSVRPGIRDPTGEDRRQTMEDRRQTIAKLRTKEQNVPQWDSWDGDTAETS